MHKLLERQLRQHLGGVDALPSDLAGLVEAVDKAYTQSDDDRAMLSHSLEILSQEFVERFQRLQEALAESIESKRELTQIVSQMTATLESTADGILVVDQHGRIVRMNQRFLDLWRIPPEISSQGDDALAIGYVLDQLADPASFVARVEELYRVPDAESFDELAFKDGRVFERYSQPQAVDGTIVGRVWSFRDVSERRQLADQLRQSQKMEAIGALAGGVAHDFNNLLTVILGCSELIAVRLGETHPAAVDVAEIHSAATRAAALTRQLLAFSRRQVLQPVPLRLDSVVSATLSMLRRLIGANIEFVIESEPDLGWIAADPGQIEQVLMNLVLNARDAMPQGGRITIITRNAQLNGLGAYESSHGLPSGAFVQLSVADSGDGIASDHLERVFEPFFTTKEAGRGTGLGLSTVFGIVAQSGGHITLDSHVGRGTVFHVYLPRLRSPEEHATHTPARLPALHGSETVLVVEDEVGVRGLVERILTNRGYRTLVAADAEEAQRIVAEKSGRIDLVLTDVVMPGINGIELAGRVRARYPDIRVVLMSGYVSDELERAGGRNAHFLLEKPFSELSLAQAVRDALDSPPPATDVDVRPAGTVPRAPWS
ncbi:MAG: response regulator [Gemmatimonadetes bacterium]|nr:response regulator [Gemmatimonadota bacterium]